MDHWDVLGLEPGADAESLKQAFRRQARRWHPDLNGNDPAAEERFKKINEAYEVLSDPVKRKKYDEEIADQKGDYESETETESAADEGAEAINQFYDFFL